MIKIKKKKSFRKKLTAGLLSSVVSAIFISSSVSAAWTQGYDGVSDYANCEWGSRAGGQYVQKLHDALVMHNIATSGSVYRDSSAWASDLTGSSSFADTNQFFAFAGHGLNPGYFSNGKGGSAHFYTLNSSSSFHNKTTETAAASNAQWDDIRWGKNKMRWATMYTCRFLSNDGSTTNETKIWNMFRGLRLMNGFATRMYLDSREASLYASRIAEGWTIKNAFVDAAYYYQPQLPIGSTSSSPPGSVIARTKGYSSAASDTKATSSPAAAPVYSSSNAGSFQTWDNKITVTGYYIP